MILLIDNYDSFTYNLAHYLEELGAEVVVRRNDKISVQQVTELKPDGIVLSPGPCDPDAAGVCLELIDKGRDLFPMLGVCLGHQAIGQVFGGRVVRTSPMHGKVSRLNHCGKYIFSNLAEPFTVTRYHSLIVDKQGLPDCLEITAESDDGLIMGLKHRDHEIHGVQFHPESIASEHGHELIANFLRLANKGK